MKYQVPKNLTELKQRCQQMAGKKISDLANELNIIMPDSLTNAKGWLGQMIESYLGASGGSRAIQDFPQLGLELKTIPVNILRKPLESTYVCTVQTNEAAIIWEQSWVYKKLANVLWIPIQEDSDLKNRKILDPIFWKPDSEINEVLKEDWEELMEMIQLGYGLNLTAKIGTYLHIRPKAANSNVKIDYLDAEGNNRRIVPKGFYLRTNFTNEIINN